jgi:hypothetical protein
MTTTTKVLLSLYNVPPLCIGISLDGFLCMYMHTPLHQRAKGVFFGERPKMDVAVRWFRSKVFEGSGKLPRSYKLPHLLLHENNLDVNVNLMLYYQYDSPT